MIFAELGDLSAYPCEIEAARTLANGVDDGWIVLCAHLDLTATVVAQLVELRRAGKSIALVPFASDHFEDALAHLGLAIFNEPNADRQYSLSENLMNPGLQLDALPLDAYLRIRDPARHRWLFTALALANVTLFSSFEQKRRWEMLVSRTVTRFDLLPLARLPAQSPRRRGSKIVVYAPTTLRAGLRFFDVVFKQRHFDVAYICAEDPSTEMLASAAVVVAPALDRLSHAVSLSRAGHTVVAPFRSGCAELGFGYGYDPTRGRTLTRAIDEALTATPLTSHRFATNLDRRVDDEAPLRSGPLVSVIVRTTGTRATFAAALESLARQTYANLEVIVVNDGGDDVSGMLDPFAGRLAIRSVLHERRRGISAGLNSGIRAATGSYISYLDDDDIVYPEHLSRLVEPLERTGHGLAYSNALAVYRELHGDRWVTTEHTIFCTCDFQRDIMYLSGVAQIHAIVHRRELIERHGYFDESLPAGEDYEMWLRLSRTHDFLHVDRITCEYHFNLDAEKGNAALPRQRRFLDGFQSIYTRYASEVANRPMLQHQQAATIAGLQAQITMLEREPHRLREAFSPMQPQP